MDAVLETTEAARHIFIYFNDDLLRIFTDSHHMGSVRSEIEIAVLIHRSYLEHCNIVFAVQIVVVTWKLGITDRSIVSESSADVFTFNTGHMPGVPGEVLTGIFTLKYSERF